MLTTGETGDPGTVDTPEGKAQALGCPSGSPEAQVKGSDLIMT